MRIQTLVGPFKKVDGQESEPERSARIKARATVATIRQATAAIRKFAGAQEPVITLPVQSRATKSLERMDNLIKIAGILTSVFELDALIATETPADTVGTASLDDGLGLQAGTPVQRATKLARMQSARQAALGTPSNRIRRRICLSGNEDLIRSVGLQP